MLRAIIDFPGSVGQNAVIQEMYLDGAVRNLSIGRIFARNVLAVLKDTGAASVGLSTADNGAYFWQNIGFVSCPYGQLSDVVGMGASVLTFDKVCAGLQSRIVTYAAWGLLPEKTIDNILSGLDPEDPANMGAVLDRDIKIPHLHAVLGRELYAARNEGILPPPDVIRKKIEKGKLKKLFATLGLTKDDVRHGKPVGLLQHMLYGTRIAASLDFASAQQRARLEKTTAGACVDVKKLQKRLNRLGLAL